MAENPPTSLDMVRAIYLETLIAKAISEQFIDVALWLREQREI